MRKHLTGSNDNPPIPVLRSILMRTGLKYQDTLSSVLLESVR